MDDDERQRLLDGFNATGTHGVPDRTILQAFKAQAQRTPDAVAIMHGEELLTYADLDARAECMADHLAKYEVQEAFASNPAYDASRLEAWAPLLNSGRVVMFDQHATRWRRSNSGAYCRSKVSTWRGCQLTCLISMRTCWSMFFADCAT